MQADIKTSSSNIKLLHSKQSSKCHDSAEKVLKQQNMNSLRRIHEQLAERKVPREQPQPPSSNQRYFYPMQSKKQTSVGHRLQPHVYPASLGFYNGVTMQNFMAPARDTAYRRSGAAATA